MGERERRLVALDSGTAQALENAMADLAGGIAAAAFRAAWDEGLTVEEAEILCKVSGDDSYLVGPMRVEKHGVAYEIHPLRAKLHAFHAAPAPQPLEPAPPSSQETGSE